MTEDYHYSYVCDRLHDLALESMRTNAEMKALARALRERLEEIDSLIDDGISTPDPIEPLGLSNCDVCTLVRGRI